MKRYIALTGLTMALCAAAIAQETLGDRVVVPARNTTRPRIVNAHVIQGSITVKAYAGKEVIVESRSSSSRRERERTVEGLRRIDLPPRGMSVEEEDNVVEVRVGGNFSGDLLITVPTDTSLRLTSIQGNVTAEGVRGEVEAKSNNGEVRLFNISGTVIASSANGDIKVTMDQVDPAKPLSFSSNNGDVDVTLPAAFKGNVKLRSLHGEVYSDFEIKLTAGQPQTSTTTGGREGRFRVVFDRTFYGTINGGGAEASFNTLNGKILLRKK